MADNLRESQKLSEQHKQQRDSARTERDSAREERDKARTERDNLKGKASNLEKNNVAQEQFLATISHDLRNPIGAIKMAIEILRGNPDLEQLEKMIDLIERNADQAGELITQLLDANLIKSGVKLPIKTEHCDILPILRDCIQSLAPQNQRKIIFTPKNGEEIWGFWDPQALKRAFNNLISNAIKYGEPEESIHIKTWQQSDITSISFQNFGQTIPLEDQLRIFDSHYRVQNNETQSKKGWGLGLTLVRGIAEAHNGKVEVTSSKAEGTTFTLRLPNDARTS